MVASSPLNHIFISPLKALVDSSQEKLKKKGIFLSVLFLQISQDILIQGVNLNVIFIGFDTKALIYILYSNKMITLFLSFARAMIFFC